MKREFKHSKCLLAVFLVGNLIISFPKGEGTSSSLWGFLISVALSLVLILFYSKLQSQSDFSLNIFAPQGETIIAKGVLFTAFFIFCLISFLICCKDYVLLVDTVRLVHTPRVLIAAVFIGLSLLMAYKNQKVTESFSLVSFLVCLILSIVMFMLSANNFKFSFLKDSLSFNFGAALKQTLTFYIHSFGQILIALVFIGSKPKKRAIKLQFFGIGFSFVILFVCISLVFLLLGNNALKNTNFPYAAATSSVVSQNGYNRLDGFTYYIFFICALLKASVILSAILIAAQQIDKRLKPVCAAFVCLLGFLFAVVPMLNGVLVSKPLTLFLLILEIILPIAIYFFIRRRGRLAI